MLWCSVVLTFSLIVNVVVICLVLEFPIMIIVMSVNIVLCFRMGEIIVMNILVNMVAGLNFLMDTTVEWDFQMSDECDGISSKLWLFSGSSEDSESVSYGYLFSADIDWLLNG